jgi:hypothetical protein
MNLDFHFLLNEPFERQTSVKFKKKSYRKWS